MILRHRAEMRPRILWPLSGGERRRKSSRVFDEDVPSFLVTHHLNFKLQEKPMKTLRQLTASALLMLVLALPVFAGDMQFPVAPAPPPPAGSTPGTQTNPASGGTTLDAETANLDPLTEISLLMLRGVLALF